MSNNRTTTTSSLQALLLRSFHFKTKWKGGTEIPSLLRSSFPFLTGHPLLPPILSEYFKEGGVTVDSTESRLSHSTVETTQPVVD